MFSNRFPASLAPNRLIRTLNERKSRGERVIDLTQSNPTKAGFLYDERAVLDAISSPQSLAYDPSPRGLLSARKAIADYYRTRGAKVDPDSLLLTASTSEAYGYLFKLLADPGDEIFIPRPGYPLLEWLAQMESLHLIPYPLQYGEEGWHCDFETLRNCISDKTRAIVVVSPNNPTGSYLKKEELKAYNELCLEYGLSLLIDEVFSDYCHQESPHQVRCAVGNEEVLTFVLNGFSKVLALPQVKLGWMHIGGPSEKAKEARDRLELIADTYLSVSTPIQHAVPLLLPKRQDIQTQINSRLNENERFLKKTFSSDRLFKREGGWYAIVRFDDQAPDERRTLDLLEQDGIFVHPGYFYDFQEEGFLVVSLLTLPRDFQTGISKIASRFC